MSMARSAARWTGLLAATVALLVVGCTDGKADESRRATSEVSPTSTPRASDAATALAEYGFTLPAEATQTRLELLPDQEDRGMLNVYRVTFTAPADTVAQMCLDAGLNDPLVVPYFIDADRELYGLNEAPEGAQACEASRPDNYRQSLRVLFWGDPASVIVMLYTMPVR